MSSDENTKKLEVEMGKLTVQIDSLNKNFDSLSKSMPELLNKIDNQTSMLIKLIEQKDENYHRHFVHKDVYEESQKTSSEKEAGVKTRIEKIENVISKLTWAVVIVVIASVLKLIIK